MAEQVASGRRLSKESLHRLLEANAIIYRHESDQRACIEAIVSEARRILSAERCSVFLIDKETDELHAEIFDNVRVASGPGQSAGRDVRVPSSRGICGHSYSTGQVIKVDDVSADERFFPAVDDYTGFSTRSVLCAPVHDGNSTIGVIELINKHSGEASDGRTAFSDEDVLLLALFALHAGAAFRHASTYDELRRFQARAAIAHEMMMYHMRVPESEVDRWLRVLQGPAGAAVSGDAALAVTATPGIDEWSFSPRTLSEDDTLRCALHMFYRLGLVARYGIEPRALIRYVLTAKKGYRDEVPYHNWLHGLSVAHFAYLLQVRGGLPGPWLSQLQADMLFIAALTHDIDHRGTTNAFLEASGSCLAALYTSQGGILEQHHSEQTLNLLQAEGMSILQNAPSEVVEAARELIQHNILATDLAHHFRIMPTLKQLMGVGADGSIVSAPGYVPSDARHQRLLCSLCMTAADLNASAKPFDLSRSIAELVYREFFAQGDREKRTGRMPAKYMDREIAEIPIEQGSFLDHVALPAFRLLSRLMPGVADVLAAAEANRKRWQHMADRDA